MPLKMNTSFLSFIVITSMFFPPGAQAQFVTLTTEVTASERADFITTLNEQNIQEFLEEVRNITTGQRQDMLNEDVIN